jgi:hypothetical protein
MKTLGAFRLIPLMSAVTVAFAFSAALPLSVQAGHQIAGGDCWHYQPGVPKECRLTWRQGSLLYMRLIDQFSGYGESSWYSQADAARSTWTSASGPQDFSWSSRSNDSWDYLKTCKDGGGHDCYSGIYGVTWNCPSGGQCSDQAVSMNIQWSELYFDVFQMDNAGVSNANRQFVFAHEMGHSLGLDHHCYNGCSGYLMEQGVLSTLPGPQAGDIGPYPPCNNGIGVSGIRCLYNY